MQCKDKVAIVTGAAGRGMGRSFAGAIDQCDHRTAWEQRSNVSPQDIAEGEAFLCSDAGRFITGAVLPYLFN